MTPVIPRMATNLVSGPICQADGLCSFTLVQMVEISNEPYELTNLYFLLEIE